MTLRTYRDEDADLSVIRSRMVAIVGYGNQGRAHARNLRDSGVEVVVGGRAGATLARAAEENFTTMGVAEAAGLANVLLLSAPDELQSAIYDAHIAPNLKPGAALIFAHGFSIHFGTIKPRADLDVILVAPEGPGHQLRSEYERGNGLPALIAAHRDATGNARAIALAYAAAIGAGRSGIMETTFKDECETDLFGEQVALCGGQAELIRAAYDTLVEAGYPPEMAYFECAHQMVLLGQLIQERGIAGMNAAISNTAEFGEYLTGPRIVNDGVKAEMKRVLADIQSGKFAREWIAENQAGQPRLKAMREKAAKHPIEAVGARLRAMMPWLRK
jgi:ketol-acid reductoisomerase